MQSNASNLSYALDDKYAYTEQLFACMFQRYELLDALNTLAETQSLIASQNDVDVMLGLLARKQTLLEELAAVQERLEPYFTDQPDERVWQSSARRELCRKYSEQGQLLLAAIMQLEEGALTELTSRREAVAAQLQDGKDSIIASTAYRTDNVLGNSRLDIDNL